MRSFVGSAAGAASTRSERAAIFLRASLGFVALTRASLGFVALTRASLGFFVALTRASFGFAAFARRVRPATALVFAVLAFAALVFAALGFATLARVALAFGALALAVFARVALAFVALALTFVARAFALALVVLSLAAARVGFVAFVFFLAAAFLALDALARFAATRVVFFAFAAADFFLAPVRVARAGVRVALRRAGAADLRAVARFVVTFRRFAAFTAAVRRAAGREDAAFRFGLRAAERAAGFAFRVRAVEAARLELTALALVALFRSFFEVFRVFFAAMGVLSHNRSGCPLPRCGELTYDPKGLMPARSLAIWGFIRQPVRCRSGPEATSSIWIISDPPCPRACRAAPAAGAGAPPCGRTRARHGSAPGPQLSTLMPSRCRTAKYSSLTA
ncbi:hypothetical protein [Sorangium sp. So ce887]|uniref:hypothetical protein n=1 Tax=Sorangium sp. So ce887 TaxID=3133324 RepID=UPI003F5D8553